jgi:alpha-L-arabinofuranosidase
LFVVNRSLNQSAPIEIHLADRQILALENGELLSGPDAKSANSYEQPDLVKSRPWGEVKISNGQANFDLPALSVGAFTWQLE